MAIKANIILDTRRQKKDNTYPVKLRVTYERKQNYYPTGYDLIEDDYKRAMFGERQTTKEKQTKKAIQAFEDKANDIIKELSIFSWEIFEKKYHTDRAAKETINLAFTEYAASLRKEGQIGTAVSYESSLSSLNKFSAGAKFSDITPEFLRRYERWILGSGKSVTTVGIYLRPLRAILNSAIADGTLTKDYYPFGKKKYEIPTGRNIKKALTIKEIALIYYYEAKSGSVDEMARDFWMFMYLCNGMNMKDVCLLKFDNIKGDILEFVRAKTARTKRNVEPIRVVLVEDAKAIISRWSNTKQDGSTYIFPILTKGLTPQRERELIQLKTHVVNEHMKDIAEILGIEGKVTTYAARHSFGTILQRSGAPVAFISEAYGHGNIQTTQNYLAGFEDDKKAETVQALTAFKIKPTVETINETSLVQIDN